MQQLIYFIRKYRYFLLFISLEILAFYFTIQHYSYHQSKFVNSANAVSGGLYNKVNSITEYLHLKTENQLLNEENIRLKNIIESHGVIKDDSIYSKVDSLEVIQRYNYKIAKVINNNYSKRNNTLTINKGTKDGLKADLGVINGNGVIGVVKNVSENFATVLSILNSSSKINVRLKKSSHFGTLVWNGKDYRLAQIIDIPRQANLKKGDTIITGGKSAIFPEGILIGTINDIKINDHQYQQINVLLFNDMSTTSQVQIVENLQRDEQKSLEELSENE